jgi:hypothetical protein
MDRALAIAVLRACGWNVEESPDGVFHLPPAIADRYPRIPEQLTTFLGGLRVCEDAHGAAWFLCQADYEGASQSAFRWNEWEEISLKAAMDGKDVNWAAKIRAFWTGHFPFMLSVAGGYGYVAVRVGPDDFGRIVRGQAPEFEEVEIIADSFDQFLREFLQLQRPVV